MGKGQLSYFVKSAAAVAVIGISFQFLKALWAVQCVAAAVIEIFAFLVLF
jgi:hypothetical protein